MPWLASQGETLVTPHDVTADTSELQCLECNAGMYVRQSHEREDGAFVARHFVHDLQDGDGGAAQDCHGGESETHQRMKSIAISKFKHVFGEVVGDVFTEKAVCPERIADVVISFTDSLDSNHSDVPHGALGDSLAIEVQYRHEDKDVQAVTEDYLCQGHSVLWLWEEQFSSTDVDLYDPPDSQPGLVPLYPGLTNIQGEYPSHWTAPPLHEYEPEHQSASVPASFPPEWFRRVLQQHLVTNGSPQYERLVTLFPERAARFKSLVEEAAEDPQACIERIDERVQNATMSIERVCGNCTHAKEDENRGDQEALLCWENTPDHTNRPRQVTSDDKLAGSCLLFKPPARQRIEVAEEKTGLPATLVKSAVYDSFKTDARRRFALRCAFYLTWPEMEWMHPFTPRREAKLAEHLGIDLEAVPETVGEGEFDEQSDSSTTSDDGAMEEPETDEWPVERTTRSSKGQSGLDEFFE